MCVRFWFVFRADVDVWCYTIIISYTLLFLLLLFLPFLSSSPLLIHSQSSISPIPTFLPSHLPLLLIFPRQSSPLLQIYLLFLSSFSPHLLFHSSNHSHLSILPHSHLIQSIRVGSSIYLFIFPILIQQSDPACFSWCDGY